MKIHHLKLHEDYCDDALSGRKPFEIRKNDRDYQVGDHVIFQAVKDDPECWRKKIEIDHAINGKEFEITYILNGNGWLLQKGWVIFATKEYDHV